MRESDRNLDSLTAVDAAHLQPLSEPEAFAPGANDAATSHSAVFFHAHHADPPLEATTAGQIATPAIISIDETATIPPSGSTLLRDRVLVWLQHNVPEARLQHILRVERMAVELAEQHQVNRDQAAQAGLMHDLAKFFKPQRLLDIAQAERLDLDPVDLANPHLLHADVGAIVARDEFAIHDAAVLEAIRNHTLGRPGMSALSCIVFLADSLEPGRGDTPELATLRQLSHQDLHHAVWQTCEDSLRYLIAHSRLIHPRMILTRNWAMSLARQPS